MLVIASALLALAAVTAPLLFRMRAPATRRS